MVRHLLTIFLVAFVILIAVEAIQGQLTGGQFVSDALTALAIGVAGALLMRATNNS